MELIIWRHADAGDALADPLADLERCLSERGRKQAERVSRWLRDRLPADFEVLASPASRTCETAAALGVPVRVDARLVPGRGVADHLAALNWSENWSEQGETGSRAIILVGHQPSLGRLASRLLAGQQLDWSIRKGQAWWLSRRMRAGQAQVVLRAAITAELT